MDAAVTPACLFNNAKVLKTELEKTEAVVLSHGHPNHSLGLIDLLKLLHETQNAQNTQNLKNT
jgi:7,8-dihydropterin-6-yl-methyl-4-(beta-D-ribofuranosyl)aminobenzene 5'-phosphate synthase